jgi:hypothetical protein
MWASPLHPRAQLPKIFVYLRSGDKRVSYTSFEFKEIASLNFRNPPGAPRGAARRSSLPDSP